ncbi:hypothetical protein JRQ81_017855 [Phrynocephalus forsythii]|uniref:Uncharacterized protein n=1 Tax=Phrynocephalus forsythii TaxID=171643 RepID=A0A9Q1B0W9_9SAUR|nr:hypothetical protein JRQ81_017855 [Phrynocephalus forsythii]
MPKPKQKPKPKANSDIYILEKLLQTYEKHCMLSQTCASPTIKKGLQKCIANGTLITKFVLTNVETLSGNLHPVSLTPLLRAIRDERYQLGKDLCIWGIKTSPQDIANLAILLELDGRTIYPFSKLEITHQVLDRWSTERLGVALPYSNLSTLVLDYSKCGDDGISRLTSGLEGNGKLLTLSLCYCDLGPASGTTLAKLVTQTAISSPKAENKCPPLNRLFLVAMKLCTCNLTSSLSNLFLNGNCLQCLGATELLKPIAEYAEKLGQEKKANDLAYSNLDEKKDATIQSKDVSLVTKSKNKTSTAMESIGKKKKKKGFKKRSKNPGLGPWLAKLHLADNAIDGRFNQREKNLWEFILLLACLIKNSHPLVEVDINGNAIGEQCAIKILEALQDRKKEGMPHLKIQVTPQISSVTFEEIFRSCLKTSQIKKRKKKTK